MRTLSGKSITIDLDDVTTISDLKSEIEDREGVPAMYQLLTLGGRLLQDHAILQHGVSISLLVRLYGGMQVRTVHCKMNSIVKI